MKQVWKELKVNNINQTEQTLPADCSHTLASMAANVCLFAYRVDNYRTSGELLTRKSRSFSNLWQCSVRRPMPSGKRSASSARKAAMFSLNTCCPPSLQENSSFSYLAASNSPSLSLGPVGSDQASLLPSQEWPSFLFCQPTRAAPGLD